MKIGYALETCRYRYVSSVLGDDILPVYPPRTEYRLNPAWPGRSSLRRKDVEYFYYDSRKGLTSRLAAHERDFITSPPITQVMMKTGSLLTSSMAILRVRGGIRIGDLLEYCERTTAVLDLQCVVASFAVPKE